MNELFQIPESKSPRLQWMARHHMSLEMQATGPMWQAKHGMKVMGVGETQDDALTAAAKALNIKLWNEE